ncbi:L-fuculose kinase [Verrucomicrobiota bacterium]|nr:L-fuculose kinase [Verrucomicrobiota bacterium]
MLHHLAIDLGAESGRLILGTLDGLGDFAASGSVTLTELHRFPNTPLKHNGSLHWNIPQLFAELKTGLRRAAELKLPIASISTDSWGVDYLLFDPAGELMSPTFHYRDPRHQRGEPAALAKVSRETIFAETGIQHMAINTIFQLAAEDPARLQRAGRLLHIADGFNYLLSGVAAQDHSNASTSQLYNPVTRAWSRRLIDALDLPPHIFPPLVPCGTRLGTLTPALTRETGLAEIPVLATCSHDTGAAVAAVPAQPNADISADPTRPDWAYLSSGTWSLMGVELPAPVLTENCRQLNFTNEIGHGNSVRLLKNIIGLWLVQECRRDWAQRGHDFDYAALTQLAAAAPPFTALINPADPRFLAPDDMPAKIAAFCRETGQPAPTEPGAVIRCILESLALLYCRTLRQIEQLLGTRIQRLHIVGGGSKNALLNQLTADALEIPVHAGPVEATALGNILLQSLTLGHLPSLAAARALVRTALATQIFTPQPSADWVSARARFEKFFAAAK